MGDSPLCPPRHLGPPKWEGGGWVTAPSCTTPPPSLGPLRWEGGGWVPPCAPHPQTPGSPQMGRRWMGPHGQQHWPEGHPACGGRAQSPIDIRTRWAQPDPSLPPICPVGQPGTPAFTLSNNGHTAVLALPPSLRLQGLPRSFAAAQLHFHWGRPGHAGGAEHLLDGHRAPAEMHVVHYDVERYTNASEAQHHAGGLAVLGVLLEVGADPHPTYDNILSHLGSIRYAGQTTAIPSFSVQDLLPPRLDLYYRYNGSLTTPPCFQSVLWTLFQQPVRISLAQLEQLQGTLYTTTAAEPEPQRLVDNFRVPQELNQRLVLSSFPRGESQLEAGGGGGGGEGAPRHDLAGSKKGVKGHHPASAEEWQETALGRGCTKGRGVPRWQGGGKKM
uniref:carbonic anhydrase n=1 Tax=Aquila chrysaetos chrysaetos TaxID=223781 RepID=A0A663DWI9_AQUCH